MRLAQVSMEYTIIVGFLLVILIPLLILYFDFSRDAQNEVMVNELNQVARHIADEVETIYFIGEPAQTKVKVYMPVDVKNATLSNNEIVFLIEVYGGNNEIVVPTKVSMNGTLPLTKGVHNLIIKAKGNWVEVTS